MLQRRDSNPRQLSWCKLAFEGRLTDRATAPRRITFHSDTEQPLAFSRGHLVQPDFLIGRRDVDAGNALEDVDRLGREVVLEPPDLLVRDRVAALSADVVVSGHEDGRFDGLVEAAVDGAEPLRVGLEQVVVDFAACLKMISFTGNHFFNFC